MSNILNIAVTGLNDAITRIANATSNIVNASSTGKLPSGASPYTGFHPQDVVTLSIAGGGGGLGVTDIKQPRNPAFVTAFDPTSKDANADGLIGAPNVDLNAELIASKEAQVSYSAGAKLIKVAQEMDKTLLDALS